MNEHETNPQRHESTSPEEPSHRPADASPAGSSPERGESDTTVQQPALNPLASLQPQPQPHSAPPAPPAPPHPGVTHPGVAQQWTGSPWQAGAPYGQPHPGQQYPPQPGQPAFGHPHPGQPHPGQPHPGQPHPGQPHPGQPQSGQPQPGAEGTWQPGSGAPIWATAVGTEPPRDPARAGRSRRILAAGAAAVVIALGAGGVGAAAALALDDGNGTATVQSSNASVTRVVDRSSLAQIVAAVKDSVVSIKTQNGEGSGVVLNGEGFIVTNNHVVATAQGGAVTVIFADGTQADGKVTGTDPRTDLAVVKVEGVDGLKPATLGSSADMQVGDTVLALGSPLGLEGSVTEGIISAKDRTIRAGGNEDQAPQNPFGGQQQQSGATSMSGLLQTDAPINPGNSGGALVNTNGHVIGINSAIATSGAGSGSIGLGFAIPSDKVKTVAAALMKGEKVSHPALGVSVNPAEGGGALVGLVSPNSAAAKAGIERGDVIKSVNGKAINDSDDLVAIIQAGKVGDTVSITFTRNGQEQKVNATLAEAS
ncbi:trypsin-like peptidase domain-containing protein [Couchioplanes caeruleus]|uniref:Trypsin n=2 Tax=Couchioplanes caeruleus TaxID=56438 RepID=A0A1K0FFP3_9ACTN|nr:trypsin-like peptidase domain-containing protein [Couchioplanes caeruleus]OJF11552.1 trypsin [Couchioplanes caeruleus subsp. caeruleus]ROP32232.1 putative serine protease PepD [Couchioplanes caeruleus]